MQYKVPQDVQREDTIIGPITIKQLIILMVGGGISYTIYTTLSKTYFIEIWLAPVLIVAILTLAFAFLKINSIPFHLYLLNLLQYIIVPRKRRWKKGSGDTFIPPFTKIIINEKKEDKSEAKEKPKTIKELTDIIDKGITQE